MIRLFSDTFPEVIRPVFGSTQRCADLLEESVSCDRVLTAVLGEQLVGFAGLHYSGRQWFDPSMSQIIRVMRWRTIRVVTMGIILFKRPRADVMHLDTLVVRPDVRGQGIGTRLIEASESVAQTEGKRLLTLEVEDINLRAKQLYERVGFKKEKFRKLPWPWRKAFSFSGSFRMNKDVPFLERSIYSEEASSTGSKPSSK